MISHKANVNVLMRRTRSSGQIRTYLLLFTSILLFLCCCNFLAISTSGKTIGVTEQRADCCCAEVNLLIVLQPGGVLSNMCMFLTRLG